MNLFVDSSGWIALFGDKDKFHWRAVSGYQSLENRPISWVTTDYVFDETVTFLQKHYGLFVAQRCGNAILHAPYIKMLSVDEFAWQAAWKMFQTYDDKQWAFTDCTSFIVMQQQQIWQAFSFDQHFEQAGFRLWPGESG